MQQYHPLNDKWDIEENLFFQKYAASYLGIVFFIDILLHVHLSNIKTLSPGANVLLVPGKNILKNPN